MSSPGAVRPALLLLLLASLLGPAPAPAEPPGGAASPEASVDGPASTGGAQGVLLTSDLVYALLVAELAMQRDDQQTAFDHYLYAARLSGDPDMAGLAARAALAMDDPEAAVRATRIWSALAPDSSTAYQIAAYAYLDAGDRDAALAALADLIRLSDDPGHGYMQAAQMLSRVKQPGERLAMMEELVAGQTESADAQFALAMLAGGANDLDAARRFTERAIALRPDWNAPRLFLIRLLAASDRADEAVSVLDGYLAENPSDTELQLLRVQLHISAEEYEQALAHLDEIFAVGPPQPDLLMTAAVVALEAEAIDRARSYLLQLREAGARLDESAFLLGQVEEMAGNADAAMDWYREVRGENALEASIRLAGLHAERGEIARSQEILQQLRDQNPDEAAALYLIEGELLRERDLQDEAIAAYNEGLDAEPDQPDLLYARAMLAVGMDRLDLLERDLRQILVNHPDHVDALNALGYTLADRTDRLDEARSLIERAYQLRPDEPAILDSMGWVLFRLGDAEAAEPYLRKALDESFDPEIAAHLGEVLWALGRKDEARQVWERALDDDPDHEYLLRTLSRHRFTQTGH